MAIEDIERLKEKIEKDPNSKLFVPLAEEYKKSGMNDEAVDVLIKGLERQPGYLSARVSLGKIYFERGMLDEARAEFEKVIAAIPDNLYAHKKLAGIYKELGDKDKAVKEFSTVLKLNPMDEQAETSLAEIEGKQEFQAQKPVTEKTEVIDISEEEKTFEIPLPRDDMEVTGTLAETKPETEHEEEKIPETLISDEDMGALKQEPETVAEIEEEEEKPSEISMNEEDRDLWKAHLEAVEQIEEGKEPVGISLTEEEIQSWGSPTAAPEESVEAIAEISPETEEMSEAETLSFEDMLKEPEVAEVAPEEEPASREKERQGQPAFIEKADQFILQGNYAEALNIYKNLLSSEPDNLHIMQRAEELKTLLKLLGKDKEVLIGKLDSFLDSIKKRRDEFFGST